jgi:hypothetical protein
MARYKARPRCLSSAQKAWWTMASKEEASARVVQNNRPPTAKPWATKANGFCSLFQIFMTSRFPQAFAACASMWVLNRKWTLNAPAESYQPRKSSDEKSGAGTNRRRIIRLGKA